ncbi:MAG TPA: lipopolysaccharide heptosyltransferase II [Accumulibacter sp.]|uniref:lipopolysaccharide heptosyltransferase II n=1 Tax=Accumulibacter sp. TaxID=2053492 RepID=UPI002CCE657A|nr:lipopolysaccharide heptosyltransferase II [Accumulibacter sp.]HND38194.1 lipopolysaccharide heptosyltransferase II [Accumulibacter sp.]HNG15301.1 lipopolysaccharide heptosyltransferase II [Accumulibacter sp.]HNJ49677.1 lipopolysaccharide heptosyltransferase II [Accumulibacter sp.]
MKALIVAPSWIGDTVLAQPLCMRLHERMPGLQLDALAPRWVAPVLERMPEIAQIVDSPFAHGDLSLRARHRLARKLATNGYQRAYVLPNSLKSALIPFLADIPQRIGFVGEKRYGLINHRHTLDKTLLPQMAERFAQLAEAPGAALPRPLPRPRLRSSADGRAFTCAALALDLPEKLAVFCPGAEYGPAKRWPARHFALLADLLGETGHTVWLLGSEKDRPIAEEIVALAGPARLPLNLCGRTSLGQAIDLIAAASLVVCNDSGLMHVAAALDRRLIALYGSSSPTFTPPLSERATILSLGLACSPCFQRRCPLGHLDCLNKLAPQQVLAACLAEAAP